MEKIASLTGPAIPLNLSEKVDLHQDLNNNYFGTVTPATVALITLANALPVVKDSLLLLSLNTDRQLVKKRPSQLIGELGQRALHSQAEKEKIVEVYFEKGYRFPFILGQVLLVPFDGPRKNETDWYNILLIEKILPYHDGIKGIADTLLIFEDGQEIILPRRLKAVRAKIRDSLHRGHFYFKLYDLILAADQQPASPSLSLIERKLKELGLRMYPQPGEEVLKDGLKEFRMLGGEVHSLFGSRRSRLPLLEIKMEVRTSSLTSIYLFF